MTPRPAPPPSLFFRSQVWIQAGPCQRVATGGEGRRGWVTISFGLFTVWSLGSGFLNIQNRDQFCLIGVRRSRNGCSSLQTLLPPAAPRCSLRARFSGSQSPRPATPRPAPAGSAPPGPGAHNGNRNLTSKHSHRGVSDMYCHDSSTPKGEPSREPDSERRAPRRWAARTHTCRRAAYLSSSRRRAGECSARQQTVSLRRPSAMRRDGLSNSELFDWPFFVSKHFLPSDGL